MGRPRSLAPLWVLTALITGLAIAVLRLEIAGLGRLMPSGTQVPWYVLALGFAIAEANVVHLHFRGHSHSFALGEIMLVLVIRLRRRRLKLVHTLEHFSLGTALRHRVPGNAISLSKASCTRARTHFWARPQDDHGTDRRYRLLAPSARVHPTRGATTFVRTTPTVPSTSTV